MSFTQHFASHSSLPTVRVGSASNFMPTGSYGNRNTVCSLESSMLLRPRQSVRAPQPLLTGSKRPSKHLSGMAWISAIDTASTKLNIPMTAVEPTLAFEDDGLVPGVCRLYMEGRCRQGDRCFQVHANPSVVQQLRRVALNTPSCCPAHGAKCNMEGFPLGLVVVIDPPREKEVGLAVEAKVERESGCAAVSPSSGELNTTSTGDDAYNGNNVTSTEQRFTIALHNVCPTRFLWSRYEENGGMLLHVPKSKICREHRKGLCRFGNECSFLHLCRQITLGSGEDELFSRSHTPSCNAPMQGSMQDYSRSLSSATANGSLCHQAHSQSYSTSNLPHFQGSVIVSQSGSYMDCSLGNSQTGSRPHFSRIPATSESYGSHQPLLRPLGGLPNSQRNIGTRGSFTHNPYAEASSFQG